MPARRKSVPSYLPHDKHATRARVVWTDPATGKRRYVLLPGAYNSPESREAYRRLLAEIEAAPERTPAVRAGRTVAEVLLAFLTHAERHYRGTDGEPTSEYREYRLVVRTLRELYGHTPAADFGPLCLKAVRQSWVAVGLARSEVNRRTNMARRVLKWAAGEELVPFEVYQRLTAVTGLQKGRSAARETEPVGPVDPATVAATLPSLSRQLRGLIRFMSLTGCRPGEACRLRRCDIDTSGDVWLFRPSHHKNAHRGKGRVVAIGPKAQALLDEFPTDDPRDYVFSPRRAVEERNARRSAQRKTPRYASQTTRNVFKRVADPKRAPGRRYTSEVVARAVARAVGKANERRRKMADGGDWDPVPEWAPNQLRHSHGTEVRKRFGLEAAQATLGHEKANTTEIYAEKNLALAKAVAGEVG
jgi:integrase